METSPGRVLYPSDMDAQEDRTPGLSGASDDDAPGSNADSVDSDDVVDRNLDDMDGDATAAKIKLKVKSEAHAAGVSGMEGATTDGDVGGRER